MFSRCGDRKWTIFSIHNTFPFISCKIICKLISQSYQLECRKYLPQLCRNVGTRWWPEDRGSVVSYGLNPVAILTESGNLFRILKLIIILLISEIASLVSVLRVNHGFCLRVQVRRGQRDRNPLPIFLY